MACNYTPSSSPQHWFLLEKERREGGREGERETERKPWGNEKDRWREACDQQVAGGGKGGWQRMWRHVFPMLPSSRNFGRRTLKGPNECLICLCSLGVAEQKGGRVHPLYSRMIFGRVEPPSLQQVRSSFTLYRWEEGGSWSLHMYIKVTTYRIQNAETHGLRTKTHVHKITNVLAFYMALGINYFDGGTSITRVIGRDGAWKSWVFWAQKCPWFLAPTLPMAQVMDLAR